MYNCQIYASTSLMVIEKQVSEALNNGYKLVGPVQVGATSVGSYHQSEREYVATVVREDSDK